jgi:hypothetical protein
MLDGCSVEVEFMWLWKCGSVERKGGKIGVESSNMATERAGG